MNVDLSKLNLESLEAAYVSRSLSRLLDCANLCLTNTPPLHDDIVAVVNVSSSFFFFFLSTPNHHHHYIFLLILIIINKYVVPFFFPPYQGHHVRNPRHRIRRRYSAPSQGLHYSIN